MFKHPLFGVIGKPNFSWLAKRFRKVEPWTEPDDKREDTSELVGVIRGNAGLDAISFSKPSDLHKLDNWIDTCLQFVASGYITQEGLYAMLSVSQRIDLEDYVERKRNQ